MVNSQRKAREKRKHLEGRHGSKWPVAGESVPQARTDLGRLDGGGKRQRRVQSPGRVTPSSGVLPRNHLDVLRSPGRGSTLGTSARQEERGGVKWTAAGESSAPQARTGSGPFGEDGKRLRLAQSPGRGTPPSGVLPHRKNLDGKWSVPSKETPAGKVEGVDRVGRQSKRARGW